jgi:hypothetical protein
MKHHVLIPAGALLLLGATLYAQGARISSELSVNSSFRVVSTALHTVTQRNYPWPPVQPAAYAAAPGVAAGTRSWTYTTPVRATGGSQPGRWMLVRGFTQAIHCGAAVQTFPAPNHYQFRTGIAPAAAGTGAQKVHGNGTDIVNIADQATAITQGGITEISFNLATPIPLVQAVDLMFFVEFRGGEWRDDVNGGQTTGVDWRGAWFTPSGLAFSGFADNANPRTITLVDSTNKVYRPKVGLILDEPVFVLTGDHGNGYYAPRLANELYRGLSAAYADWSTATNGTLFFDLGGGTVYGSGGQAVVFLNVGPNFAGSIPIPPFGNLLLNPGDPAFPVFAGTPYGLGPQGEYTGEATPIPVPALGPPAVGLFATGQALFFNPGVTQARLSTKSGALIN